MILTWYIVPFLLLSEHCCCAVLVRESSYYGWYARHACMQVLPQKDPPSPGPALLCFVSKLVPLLLLHANGTFLDGSSKVLWGYVVDQRVSN
jgi:hypothetical protein